MSGQVAALYVAKGGCYFGLNDVDPWDEARDARLYAGPWPVVAHPPCQRWGRFWFGSPTAIAKGMPRKTLGDDGGCFAAALDSVERWGGVIEHPAGSHAWQRFQLPEPRREGGWRSNGRGWSTHVEQGFYGHWTRKPTWLNVHGVELGDLPALRWGQGATELDPALVERIGHAKASRRGIACKGGGGRNGDRERSATPLPFRGVLLSIERTASVAARAAA